MKNNYEIYYTFGERKFKFLARSLSTKENFIREFKKLGFSNFRVKTLDNSKNEILSKEEKKEIWNEQWNFDERIKQKLIKEITGK